MSFRIFSGVLLCATATIGAFAAPANDVSSLGQVIHAARTKNFEIVITRSLTSEAYPATTLEFTNTYPSRQKHGLAGITWTQRDVISILYVQMSAEQPYVLVDYSARTDEKAPGAGRWAAIGDTPQVPAFLRPARLIIPPASRGK